jgi:hypothetical protein
MEKNKIVQNLNSLYSAGDLETWAKNTVIEDFSKQNFSTSVLLLPS